jgi:hypothetical protein
MELVHPEAITVFPAITARSMNIIQIFSTFD